MKFLVRAVFVFLAVACVRQGAAQSATFTIGMAQVSSTNASLLIAPSSLFQLVNLGPDGLFDSIEAGAWVGGDDSLINLAFPNSDGWTSAQAFDASDGPGEDGVFFRQFTFTLAPLLPSGTKIGIRWFPTIDALDFATTTTTPGLAYGQFTQLFELLYDDTSLWEVPGAGSAVDFDPMLTPSYDPEGLNPNAVGVAAFTVVPEPSTVALLACWALLAVASRIVLQRDR